MSPERAAIDREPAVVGTWPQPAAGGAAAAAWFGREISGLLACIDIADATWMAAWTWRLVRGGH